MCQSGAAGYSGYATSKGYTASRKVRLFEVDPQARRVTTWKRVFGPIETGSGGKGAGEIGKKLDEQALVADGRAGRGH